MDNDEVIHGHWDYGDGGVWVWQQVMDEGEQVKINAAVDAIADWVKSSAMVKLNSRYEVIRHSGFAIPKVRYDVRLLDESVRVDAFLLDELRRVVEKREAEQTVFDVIQVRWAVWDTNDYKRYDESMVVKRRGRKYAYQQNIRPRLNAGEVTARRAFTSWNSGFGDQNTRDYNEALWRYKTGKRKTQPDYRSMGVRKEVADASEEVVSEIANRV